MHGPTEMSGSRLCPQRSQFTHLKYTSFTDKVVIFANDASITHGLIGTNRKIRLASFGAGEVDHW